MKYRITEFSKMIGVDASKIRYYEKKGIYQHQRDENGYRVFSEMDAFRMNDFMAINSRGYSLRECIELLKGQKIEEAISGLTRNCRDMELEIELLKEKKRYAEETIRLFQKIQADRNQIWREYMPDYMVHPASIHGDFSITQKNSEVRSAWQDLMPYTRYVGYGDSKQFVEKKSGYGDCGAAVQVEEFRRLEYPMDETVELYRMGDCICFYIEEEPDGSGNPLNDPGVVQYLEQEGLEVYGRYLLFYFMMPVEELGEYSGIIALPVRKK